MAAAVRQPKPTRKGGAEPTRRPSAWSTGARASPTFTAPNSQPSRPPRVATPTALERVLQSLAGLTGTTITLSTKTGQRYEAVIASTNREGDTTGVTLKDVKELSSPGAPLKDTLFIASTNIDTWASGPADAKPPNGDSKSHQISVHSGIPVFHSPISFSYPFKLRLDFVHRVTVICISCLPLPSGFRTDTDISAKGQAPRQRELQAWRPSGDLPDTDVSLGGSAGDDETFGAGANGHSSWDQFAVNEQRFGITTQFDENVYTTKLDRSGPDFKERERKAQRIANEIMGATTSNPHIAEERNQADDDSGANEEDKYSTVVRGQNAYVPPGARKSGVTSPAATSAAKTEIPQVSVNGPDGTSIPAQDQSTPANSSKAPSPAPPANKPPADPLPAFRDFVTNEKQRLTQKKQALVKNEMDRRMAELVKFSRDFKLNKPIPDDLVPILAKDEDKQKAIREKASKDASSSQARAIGSSSSPSGPPPGVRAQMPSKAIDAARKPIPIAAKPAPAAPATTTSKPAAAVKAAAKPNGESASAKSKPSSMFIQVIPPFKGAKARQPTTTAPAQPNGASVPPIKTSAAPAQANAAAAPVSPTANNRLNVNASSFRPNPKASAFTPGAPSPVHTNAPSASVSPKPKTEAAASPNPFFGTRQIKKGAPVHIKDDFNPFKHNKVAEASTIAAIWPYNGKRYMQMFHPPPHPPQQQSPHMAPPGPPPMPPPSYEEDSAAQAAAARQYVYAYPPYGYPAQVYSLFLIGCV
ncbi:hypothetical protein HGRIS_003935 [Hohenbuehelia grisea]|uniref:LsmAD domain-containing protein n=1 Tax=Hohenbuehelia grisea TaxID=104357 RepID=A0ABR3JHA9_9AGAR